jgi:predicted transcriptional regulator
MPVVTDVLHTLADHPEKSTVSGLARTLDRRPDEVLSALSVLEAQGLALRGRDRYGLTKLGRRVVTPAEAPRISR